MLTTFFGLCFFLFFTVVARADSSTPISCLRVEHLFVPEKTPCVGCTQAYFTETEDILISAKENVVYHKKRSGNQFLQVPQDSLSNPHSILYLPEEKVYYLVDTDNHRILVLASLQSGEVVREITEIAGVPLDRPHDIAFDPESGLLYTLNPLQTMIFRFRHDGSEEKALDLSQVLDYSRSLTFIEKKLYVTGSESGSIVEITNFDSGSYRRYQSPGKRGKGHAGSWEKNGLIINDLEKFNGHWYVSSFFCPSESDPGNDHNRNKLIRFSSWDEFEQGNWQDLSHKLGDALVPYSFSRHPKGVTISTYLKEAPGKQDTIYLITSSCTQLPHSIFSLLN